VVARHHEDLPALRFELSQVVGQPLVGGALAVLGEIPGDEHDLRILERDAGEELAQDGVTLRDELAVARHHGGERLAGRPERRGVVVRVREDQQPGGGLPERPPPGVVLAAARQQRQGGEQGNDQDG